MSVTNEPLGRSSILAMSSRKCWPSFRTIQHWSGITYWTRMGCRSGPARSCADRKGVERFDPGKAALPATERQKEMVSQLLRDFPLCRGLFEYEDYIAKRPRAEHTGSHGLFTGADDPLILSQVAEAVANHPGNVWLPIISLRREDAARLGYDSAARWKDLLTSYVPQVAEAMKIPLSQYRWYAAFHDESHHPHIHMVCCSADGKSGFLDKDGIAKIKSGLAKEIFREKRPNRYMEYRIGKMLAAGLGTEQDYGSAALWFEKSAAQNYASVQYSLAKLTGKAGAWNRITKRRSGSTNRRR